MPLAGVVLRSSVGDGRRPPGRVDAAAAAGRAEQVPTHQQRTGTDESTLQDGAARTLLPEPLVLFSDAQLPGLLRGHPRNGHGAILEHPGEHQVTSP